MHWRSLVWCAHLLFLSTSPTSALRCWSNIDNCDEIVWWATVALIWRSSLHLNRLTIYAICFFFFANREHLCVSCLFPIFSSSISAFRYCVAVPTVFQSHINSITLSAMAPGHDVLILRHDRIQFSIQHDIHISILSHAGGGFIPWQELWFHHDVYLRRCPDERKWTNGHYCTFSNLFISPVFPHSFPDICILCEFIVFGSSIHHHAGVRMVTTKSIHSHEFLWHSQLFGTVFAMGFAWILRDIGQRYMGGLDWNGGRSYLLLLGRCLSKATRRFPYTQNAIIFVRVFKSPWGLNFASNPNAL